MLRYIYIIIYHIHRLYTLYIIIYNIHTLYIIAGTCVVDPCLNLECPENMMCLPSFDLASARCVCKGPCSESASGIVRRVSARGPAQSPPQGKSAGCLQGALLRFGLWLYSLQGVCKGRGSSPLRYSNNPPEGSAQGTLVRLSYINVRQMCWIVPCYKRGYVQ